jgi:hypothetical protein
MPSVLRDRRSRRVRPGRLLAVGLPVFCRVVLLSTGVSAAELKPETLAAFDRYVQTTEERLDRELRDGPFLRIEGLTEQRRTAMTNRLKRGEVVIEAVAEGENPPPVDVPNGLVHHWVGTVFMPGVTVEETLALLQDYGRHPQVYAPQVAATEILERDGDRFRVFMRFVQRKVITVVLNTEHDVQYHRLKNRAYSRSYTTRIAEVDRPGTPREREKPPEEARGFLWRLYTYWRYAERDGGTYVQCESVSLTRDIPTGLGWLIRPFVTGIPRESLEFTLGRTRQALVDHSVASPSDHGRR